MQGEDTAGQKSAWVSTVSSIVVDATAPTVARVTSSTANGAYKVGGIISLAVEFSEAIIVTNSSDLSLVLETGAVDHSATFVSTSGTSISLSYTVVAGDTTALLEAKDTASLLVGGTGAIRDAAGNNATRTLPLTGPNALIPGATCSGSTLLDYTQNGKEYLMFVYTQNALNGILEFKVSP